MAYEMKLSSPYGENSVSSHFTYSRREPNRSPQISGSEPYQNPLNVTNFTPSHPSQAVSFHSPHSLYQPSEFSNFWSTTGGYRSDSCSSYTNGKYHDNYSPHQHSRNWKKQEDLYVTSGHILLPHLETQRGGASSLVEDKDWNKETKVGYERQVFDEMLTCEEIERYDKLASISENLMETKHWDGSHVAVEASFTEGEVVVGKHDSSISFVNRESLEAKEKAKELELELETVARALIESISENMKLREELSLTKDAFHETTEKFEDLELDHKELLELEEGFEKLLEENDGLVIQVKDLQAEVNSLFEQKSTLEENISSTNNENNLLKEEKESLLLKVSELEKSLTNEVERKAEAKKSSELQYTITGLRDRVLSLQREEVRLCGNFVELERKCLEGLRKEEEMEKKITEIVMVKDEKEGRIESLIEEKCLAEKELDKALKQLNDEKKKIEQMITEKNEMAEDKVRMKTEIVELQRQLVEFKDAISELEVSYNYQEKKVKMLESDHYKAAFNRFALEKDEILRSFADDKQKGINMKKQIQEMKQHLQGIIIKEVEGTKVDYLHVVGEKK